MLRDKLPRSKLYSARCKYLKIGVWDRFGEEKINSTDQSGVLTFDLTKIFLVTKKKYRRKCLKGIFLVKVHPCFCVFVCVLPLF